jgi:hypothetical protein
MERPRSVEDDHTLGSAQRTDQEKRLHDSQSYRSRGDHEGHAGTEGRIDEDIQRMPWASGRPNRITGRPWYGGFTE